MYSISKNVSDITFREFINEGEKQGVLNIDIEAEVLGRMRKEGFTNSEIYNMPYVKPLEGF